MKSKGFPLGGDRQTRACSACPDAAPPPPFDGGGGACYAPILKAGSLSEIHPPPIPGGKQWRDKADFKRETLNFIRLQEWHLFWTLTASVDSEWAYSRGGWEWRVVRLLRWVQRRWSVRCRAVVALEPHAEAYGDRFRLHAHLLVGLFPGPRPVPHLKPVWRYAYTTIGVNRLLLYNAGRGGASAYCVKYILKDDASFFYWGDRQAWAAIPSDNRAHRLTRGDLNE